MKPRTFDLSKIYYLLDEQRLHACSSFSFSVEAAGHGELKHVDPVGYKLMQKAWEPR
jgi:hypothetical protein